MSLLGTIYKRDGTADGRSTPGHYQGGAMEEKNSIKPHEIQFEN